MMKKRIIIVSAVMLCVALPAAIFTGSITKGILSGKIYRLQNVYGEIWNRDE